MGILIQKPGILTTIQDLGRRGYRKYGINPGGAMDRDAVRIVNRLLGSHEDEAVLEMHFPAPEIVFESQLVFAIGGADLNAKLNGQPLSNWATHLAQKGQTLKFPRRASGNRAYLAIKGGFKIDKWLGSRSTNLAAGVGGPAGRTLIKGDRLSSRIRDDGFIRFRPLKVSRRFAQKYSSPQTLRILPGNEFEYITSEGRNLITSRDFQISVNSNRMGFRLIGDPIRLNNAIEMVSSAVDFGTIQLLPTGQMIVLMADHQTTGGYPRLGHVISRDLPLLAQLGPNDAIKFLLVVQSEAENAAIEFERELSLFRVGCRFQADS